MNLPVTDNILCMTELKLEEFDTTESQEMDDEAALGGGTGTYILYL